MLTFSYTSQDDVEQRLTEILRQNKLKLSTYIYYNKKEIRYIYNVPVQHIIYLLLFGFAFSVIPFQSETKESKSLEYNFNGSAFKFSTEFCFYVFYIIACLITTISVKSKFTNDCTLQTDSKDCIVYIIGQVYRAESISAFNVKLRTASFE